MSNPGPQTTPTSRTTRSQKVYSPWEVCYVTAVFDLETRMKESLAAFHAADLCEEPTVDIDDGISDLSSLPSQPNTPVHTPPPSPRLSLASPLPSPPPQPYKSDLDRRKERRKANRALSRKRKREEAAASFTVKRMRDKIVERYVKTTEAENCAFDITKVEVTPRAYVAGRDKTFSEEVYSLEDLETMGGFRLVDWDGERSVALVDSKKRVVGLLAGKPGGTDWPAMLEEATDAMEYWRGRCTPRTRKKGQRTRGEFLTLAGGISYGGGQKKPTNVKNGRRNQAIFDHLCSLRPFRRISGFATSVLVTRAPKLHTYYARTVGSLYQHDPSLQRPFPSSVLTGTTFNLGPRTVCCKHRDPHNLTFGKCAITALGRYNYKNGGHLILWDLGLAIEFPPGSTILIPSAILSHSNTRIGPTETRYSFTQYTAGGIFRWVENNFMNAQSRRQSLTPEELELEEERDARRWVEGIDMLPVLEDLIGEDLTAKAASEPNVE